MKLFSCHITTLLVELHEIDDEGTIRCPGTVKEATQLTDMFFAISIVVAHLLTLCCLLYTSDAADEEGGRVYNQFDRISSIKTCERSKDSCMLSSCAEIS